MHELEELQGPARGVRPLRKARCSEAGRIYLITTVTAQRQKVFESFAPARALVATLGWAHEVRLCNSWAFVVMPDHLHWLVELTNQARLSELMQRVKGKSARKINRIRGTGGLPVWQPGFHDHAVRREEDVRGLARYVIANPIRAGIVERVEDYPHWDVVWL